MSHDISLDVVVVNWNSGDQLVSCIESLSASGCQNVFVVDNGSTDGSADKVANLKNVVLIRAHENLGFGRACNIGAHNSGSDFLLFLNPDAAVFSETLHVSIAFMQDPMNAKVGICGVQLKDENDQVARSCSRFPSALGFFVHAIGIDKFFPFLGHSMSEWAHDTTRKVDQVIGAFFLVRRSLFESLAGFDERFFVYFEEVDFSYRANQTGWNSVYLTETQAFHSGGGTSNQVKARRLFYSLRSRLLYADKHFTRTGAASVFFATLILEPIARSALALARRSLPSLKETWQGYAMLLRWLPQWVLKGVTR